MGLDFEAGFASGMGQELPPELCRRPLLVEGHEEVDLHDGVDLHRRLGASWDPLWWHALPGFHD